MRVKYPKWAAILPILTKRQPQSITGWKNKMKTIRTKVYQFNELTEQAKKEAIKWVLNSFEDSFAWEDTKEDASQIGLKLISLSDNHSNKGEFMLSANEVAQNILNNHGSHCETYKTADKFMEEWQPVFNNYMDESHEDYESSESEDKLQEIEEEFLQSILEDYRIMYNNQLDYEYSDEFAKETIEANEYDFTKDGKRFNQ